MRKDLDQHTLDMLSKMYDLYVKPNESKSDFIKRITLKAKNTNNFEK